MQAENSSKLAVKKLAWLAPCFGLVWLACGVFVQVWLIRLLISLPAAIFLLLALLRRQAGRQVLLSREQFKWFLELLLSHLATGETLEHAISSTLPGMQQMLGSKSSLIRALTALDQQLQARRPLASLLPFLARQIRCPEAEYFFRLLPELQSSGSQIAPFVRQHLHMVTEQLTLQQEIKAESTQRRTEAGLLSLMPFLVAFLLQPGLGDDAAQSMASPAGVLGSTLACAITLAAAILAVNLLAEKPVTAKASLALPEAASADKASLSCLTRPLHSLYRDILPQSYGARLLQGLADLDPPRSGSAGSLVNAYFSRKVQLMLAALLPGLVLLIFKPAFFYLPLLFALSLTFLQDRQVFLMRDQLLDNYRLAYPVFLNLLAALLLAGLSVHRSLEISCNCLVRDKAASSKWQNLDQDLALVQKQLQTGQPAGQVLEDLISSCPLPEAQAALLLLHRYEKAGGADAIQLLTLQANACWSLYRSSSRKQLEQQNVSLLLPMAMDLVAVMLTALLPAMLSLRLF